MTAVSLYPFVAAFAATSCVWLAGGPWILVSGRLGVAWTFRLSRFVLVAGVGGLWLVLAVLFGASYATLALAVVVVAVGMWLRWRFFRTRKCRLANQKRCVEIVDTLAADLRAGALPHVAVERLAREFAVMIPVQNGIVNGQDAKEAWLNAAEVPGYEACAWVASTWAVAFESGAPLADVLECVAEDIRSELDLRKDVAAAVAPARSTALMMALLPILALGMGAGMGAEPRATITQSLVGAGSVTLGVVLAMIGILWVDRIAERAEKE